MINILRKKGNLLVTLSKKNKQLFKNLVETLKNIVEEQINGINSRMDTTEEWIELEDHFKEVSQKQPERTKFWLIKLS